MVNSGEEIKSNTTSPELNSGGVERGTIEVGKYLFDQGHESIVVSNGGRMVEQLIEKGASMLKFCSQENPNILATTKSVNY